MHDGGRCRRRAPDRLQQLRQIEYADDEAVQIATSVGDRGARRSLYIDRAR